MTGALPCLGIIRTGAKGLEPVSRFTLDSTRLQLRGAALFAWSVPERVVTTTSGQGVRAAIPLHQTATNGVSMKSLNGFGSHLAPCQQKAGCRTPNASNDANAIV